MILRGSSVPHLPPSPQGRVEWEVEVSHPRSSSLARGLVLGEEEEEVGEPSYCRLRREVEEEGVEPWVQLTGPKMVQGAEEEEEQHQVGSLANQTKVMIIKTAPAERQRHQMCDQVRWR